jgi:hypothetical protein
MRTGPKGEAMSHFVVLVLVPPGEQDVEGRVDITLAPFDENTTAPEYQRECWCHGHKATVAVREAADAEFGTFQTLREVFSAREDVTALRAEQAKAFETKDDDLYAKTEEALDALWKPYIRPRLAREKELLDARTDKEAPDPECDECHGTGTHASTYNPKSKWDWWRIGGRWDGSLFGEDVAKARRTDGGFNFSPTNQELRNNSRIVSDLPVDFTPFAILTPDGEWHERGRMGWWGIVSDEADEWPSQAKTLLEAHKDHLAVAVDCHI